MQGMLSRVEAASRVRHLHRKKEGGISTGWDTSGTVGKESSVRLGGKASQLAASAHYCIF